MKSKGLHKKTKDELIAMVLDLEKLAEDRWQELLRMNSAFVERDKMVQQQNELLHAARDRAQQAESELGRLALEHGLFSAFFPSEEANDGQ